MQIELVVIGIFFISVILVMILGKRIRKTTDFWLVGIFFLGIMSTIIIGWPHPSDRARVVIEGFSYVLIGMLLPIFWNIGRNAKRLEHFLMVGILIIIIGGLVAWTHFRVVTIHVLGNSHGGLEEELKEFNNAHKGLGIQAKLVYDWRALDTNERYEKMHKYITGTERVDIIELDRIWLEEAMGTTNSILFPLDRFFEQDMKESAFLEASLDIARHSSTRCLYAIPLFVDVGIIFYRKDLLGKLHNPITFNDLSNIMTRLFTRTKRKDLEGFVFQGARYEGLNCAFFELLSSSNTSIIGYDGNIQINTEPIISVLLKLRNMIFVRGTIPLSVLVFKEEESYKLFIEGHAIILRNWARFLQSWDDELFMITRKDIGITSFAKPVLGGWYLGIMKGSKHPKEAWEVIKFLIRPNMLKYRATNSDVSRRRIPADMDVLSELHTYFPYVFEVKKSLLKAQHRPRLQDYELFSKIMYEAIFEILYKADITEETIRDILNDAQSKLPQ